MDTFELDVIAVDKTFYTGPCRQIIVTAADGLIGIMAHHESSVIALVEGNWIDAVAGIGHVQIAYNRVHVIVDFVEKPDEIDVKRAQEALDRAKEAMRQKQSIEEYRMTKANIARAMARLAARNRYKEIK